MANITIDTQIKIGFLGAGQLARMAAQKAQSLGLSIAIYSHRNAQEPACSLTQNIEVGSFKDETALINFAQQCDVLTLENEFIDAELLKRVEQASQTPIYPRPQSFFKIQDKVAEKRFFKKCAMNIGDYQVIESKKDLIDYLQLNPDGLVLKVSKGGYDGFGNQTITTHEQAQMAWNNYKGQSLLAEKKLPLQRELAITIVSNGKQSILYPIVQTVQENHICTHVIAPANLSQDAQNTIEQGAKKFIEELNTPGIFSLEFFELKDGSIVVNESAPRPHNSAHYTMDACYCCQFENHIRAILKLPLGSPKMLTPHCVMVNLLGTREGLGKLDIPTNLWSDMDFIHLYAKESSRVGRKMGHVNLLGGDLELLLERKDKWIREYQL